MVSPGETQYQNPKEPSTSKQPGTETQKSPLRQMGCGVTTSTLTQRQAIATETK
jgi:hypothetical protein